MYSRGCWIEIRSSGCSISIFLGLRMSRKTKEKVPRGFGFPACMNGLMGFCGPFYPVKRTVCESVFFSSLKPERTKGGFHGFKGFGIPVKTLGGEIFPVSAQFEGVYGGDIWVLCPSKHNALGFAPFLTRGCVGESDIEYVVSALRRHLNAAAARARREAAKHKSKKKR